MNLRAKMLKMRERHIIFTRCHRNEEFGIKIKYCIKRNIDANINLWKMCTPTYGDPVLDKPKKDRTIRERERANMVCVMLKTG